jgi:anthranilate phosphoribosyltransferase
MSKERQAANHDPGMTMRSLIQRIATGPELSKNLSLEEARTGMRLILDGKVDPVQAGIFLIALRMKRETDDENKGVLDAVREATHTVTASVDELVEIADPYDGFNRSLPASPFLPVVLAACGVPAVSHGVESVGPKFGVTHHQVLRAAGIPVDGSPEDVAAHIEDPAISWGYVDQKAFCPSLHDLIKLRMLIVKRPAITTVEVLAGPVRAHRKTHFMTGFVHKPYPRIYALLARHAGFDSALLVRGVEGGVIPSLRQTGKIFYYHDKGEEQAIEIEPSELGIEQQVRAVPLPDNLPPSKQAADKVGMAVDAQAVAKAAARVGREALAGKPGPTRDGLVYGAAVCLWHLGRYESVSGAADAVRKVLDSGKALSHLEAAM